MQVCSLVPRLQSHFITQSKKKMGVKSGNEGTVSLDKFLTAEYKVRRVFFKTASCMYMHVVM